MTSRWKLLEEIFDSALDLPERERQSYLTNACGGDEELRSEVQSLIQYAASSESYLQSMVQATVLDFRANFLAKQEARPIDTANGGTIDS